MMQSNNIFTSRPMYGHAYTPIQTINKIFTPAEGLKEGTIFPELVSPYVPLQSMAENIYLKNYKDGGCKHEYR